MRARSMTPIPIMRTSTQRRGEEPRSSAAHHSRSTIPLAARYHWPSCALALSVDKWIFMAGGFAQILPPNATLRVGPTAQGRALADRTARGAPRAVTRPGRSEGARAVIMRIERRYEREITVEIRSRVCVQPRRACVRAVRCMRWFRRELSLEPADYTPPTVKRRCRRGLNVYCEQVVGGNKRAGVHATIPPSTHDVVPPTRSAHHGRSDRLPPLGGGQSCRAPVARRVTAAAAAATVGSSRGSRAASSPRGHLGRQPRLQRDFGAGPVARLDGRTGPSVHRAA